MPRDYEDDNERRFRRDDRADRPRERLYERDEYGQRFERRRGHSLLGILSLLAALLAGLMTFGLVVVAGIISSNQGGLPDDSPEAAVIGLGFFACVGLAIVGLILGLVGLFRPDDKLFPILGTSFNGLVLFGCMVMLCLGILAS